MGFNFVTSSSVPSVSNGLDSKVNRDKIPPCDQWKALFVFEMMLEMRAPLFEKTRRNMNSDRTNRNFLPNKALYLAGILHFIIIHLKVPEKASSSLIRQWADLPVKLAQLVGKSYLQAMVQAFQFPVNFITKLFETMTEKIHSLISISRLICIDESIIACYSKSATRRGMIRFIPGKPNPKGYFFNAALTRLSLTRKPLLLNVYIKQEFSSLGMGDAARELVLHLERVFHREFLVLLDSGYPAFSMIKQSNYSGNSKFICSCSSAKISSSFSALSTLGSANSGGSDF